MKIAIICDWLVTTAGAEKFLSEILHIYPHADLFSLIDFIPQDQRAFILNKPVTTSFLQHIPFIKKYYRYFLPLMPLAIENLDVSSYELIISISHAVAKGVITGPDQLHISYVHSPMRYAWDMQHQYLQESGLDGGVKGYLAKYMLHKMRIWDYRTSHGVDHFMANSNFIARRVFKTYRRVAKVIYPAVDLSLFKPSGKPKENFYFAASRLVPYKKMDLIAKCFAAMPDKRLVMMGDGPDKDKVCQQLAPNITFLGYGSNEVLIDHLQRAKALVFAAEEDFGLVPIEAQACGTPVIAFGKGGALETVQDLTHSHPTGVFFAAQTVESMQQAIEAFELRQHVFTLENCLQQARKFDVATFRQAFSKYVDEKVAQFKQGKMSYE